MSGTLNANYVQSDVGANLYFNTATASGGVLVGTSLSANNGLYSSNNFTGVYQDGIVVDYVTGQGRISVGTADGITIYNGGPAANALMTMLPGGNIGIGNTNPGVGGTLQGPYLQLGSITSTANNQGTLRLAHNNNSLGNSRAWDLYVNDNDLFTIRDAVSGASAVDMMNIDKSGNLNLLRSNGGISFNNSSATTNSTLNDYEQGTWTPAASSSSGTITTYSSYGYYTKIGRIVTVYCSVYLTNVGSASGQLNITNFPFATLNGDQYLGLTREVINTGYVWYATLSNSSAYIQNATGGNITWTNTYGYRFTITYEATF